MSKPLSEFAAKANQTEEGAPIIRAINPRIVMKTIEGQDAIGCDITGVTSQRQIKEIELELQLLALRYFSKEFEFQLPCIEIFSNEKNELIIGFKYEGLSNMTQPEIDQLFFDQHAADMRLIRPANEHEKAEIRALIQRGIDRAKALG